MRVHRTQQRKNVFTTQHELPSISSMLNRRSGVDASVLGPTKHLFDNGTHTETFNKLIKELRAKDHYRKMLHRQCEVIQKKGSIVHNQVNS